ncbi:hypothetical protein AB0M02_04905 [Actinoplanes sp. NPDC051861]|uniref:hypothetical protein n=1 Tax=Actinoplanes sp. NPDC051861 TaxID=3155170 RepID=UPI003419C32E
MLASVIDESERPGDWIRADRGDGEQSLAPDGVAPARLLADFLPRVKDRLIIYNRNKDRAHKLRLRFGVDCGDVKVDRDGLLSGDPIVVATRLQAHPANREAMSALSGAVLTALVSDTVYQRVVPYNARGLEESQFRRVVVEIQGRKQNAWLYVPGHQPPVVEGVPAEEPPERGSAGGETYHVRMDNAIGTQIGRNNTQHFHGGPR